VDPLESKYSPQSPFVYCSDNPINRVDPTGKGDDPTLVKPKVKVDPNVAKELTKDLPEGGKQISREFADELLKKAEQTAVKKTEKEVLKDGSKALLKKVAGAPLDVLINVLTPVDAIPGTGELPQPMKNAEDARLIRPRMLNSQELNELVKRLQVNAVTAPYEKVTTDIGKLTEQDKNEIATRIATGRGTSQDLIYASQVMQGNGRGTKRADAFASQWPTASLSDGLKIFVPNYAVTSTDQKLLYTDSKTGYEVIYDKEGDYFRIRDTKLPGRRVFVDFSGQAPNNKVENGKTTGRTQDEYNQITHFKNTDKLLWKK